MKVQGAWYTCVLFTVMLSTAVQSQWLDPQWKKTIVLFEAATSDTTFSAVGTGFVVNYEERTFLITNRHIAQNSGLYARFNLKSNADRSVRCSIDSVVQRMKVPWGFSDTADIAVLPLLVYPDIAAHDADLDIISIGLSRFRDWASITEGDDVYVLGFPMQIGSGQHYLPVVRGGIVALKEKPGEFLIDANIFPGNSGGPVFTRSNIYDHRTGAIGGLGQIGFLIGVVAAYIPYIDVGISQQTKHARITFEENSGLALVYSTDQIEHCIHAYIERYEK